MRPRTKRRLKFYLNVVAIIGLSLAVGILFEYLASLTWQMRFGLIDLKYEYFIAAAAILFMMFLADIVLFFRLVMRREYW